jgi:hypothetical protein
MDRRGTDSTHSRGVRACARATWKERACVALLRACGTVTNAPGAEGEDGGGCEAAPCDVGVVGAEALDTPDHTPRQQLGGGRPQRAQAELQVLGELSRGGQVGRPVSQHQVRTCVRRRAVVAWVHTAAAWPSVHRTVRRNGTPVCSVLH